MRLSIYSIIIILTIIASCKSKLSEDESHLDMYFEEKHNIKRTDFNNYFLIVISGDCGSCTEKTIKFLKRIGDPNNKRFSGYKKIVIVPENNAYVLDSVKNTSIKFFVEEGFELEKYGIKFPKNTLFEFKNNNLIYKDWLYLENVDKVAKKYGLSL